MPGVVGSDWNASAPLRVLFYLSGDAQISQVEQLETALKKDRIVQAVQLSIPT